MSMAEGYGHCNLQQSTPRSHLITFPILAARSKAKRSDPRASGGHAGLFEPGERVLGGPPRYRDAENRDRPRSCRSHPFDLRRAASQRRNRRSGSPRMRPRRESLRPRKRLDRLASTHAPIRMLLAVDLGIHRVRDRFKDRLPGPQRQSDDRIKPGGVIGLELHRRYRSSGLQQVAKVAPLPDHLEVVNSGQIASPLRDATRLRSA